MKTVVVKNQKEFDRIKEVKADEEIIFESEKIKINCVLEVCGTLTLKGEINCSLQEQCYIEARGNSSLLIEARGNSSPSIVARDNSSPSIEAWDNSSPSIIARGNSPPSIIARGNSSPSIVAWDNSSPSIVALYNSSPSIVAWGNSSPSIVARGNSSPLIEALYNSSPSIVAWGNSVIRLLSGITKPILLHDFSILTAPFGHKITVQKEKTCIVQRYNPLPYLQREGVTVKNNKCILYKRVSSEFDTQEGTKNETKWGIGTTVVHPVNNGKRRTWQPGLCECGDGKFHACSRPYFCDEFRNMIGDRYIAIQINTKDLYEWPNPQYPHKIAFRKGKVLYGCDKYGGKLRKDI